MSINLYDGDYIRFSYAGSEFACLIQTDFCPEDPREMWHTPSHMLCWHRRYSIGDTHNYNTPEDFIKELAEEYVSLSKLREIVLRGRDGVRVIEKNGKFLLVESWHGEDYEIAAEDTCEKLFTNETKNDILEALHCSLVPLVQESQEVAILPIYLYDHSGLEMRTTDFADRWDSCQVGWIYITKLDFLRETQNSDESQWQRKAVEFLQKEVAVYSDYLYGNIYGYVEYSKEEDGNWKETGDSCWGFYGSDILTNGIAEAVDGLLEAVNEESYTTGRAEKHIIETYSFA